MIWGTFPDMLGMAWSVLEWVVTYGWILCACIFLGVMVWTVLNIAAKLVGEAAPGWLKLFRRA